MPETMAAIVISKPGPPDVLKLEERPLPVPQAGEILIKVAAAGVNRPDIAQRQGLYPPPKGASELPGLEVAGLVAACGGATSRYKAGDPVCALTPGGGYAAYVTTPELHALPIPKGFDFVEAACLPETFFTVWHNVFQRGALKSGEWLLVHAGASGIGTAAIQMAKACGAGVIVTASSDEKCRACLALGADHAVNVQRDDYTEAVKHVTDGHGADVILDMMGGGYVARNYKAAAMDGRIVQIASLQGDVAETDFNRLKVKRLIHTGSTLRPQSIAAKAKIAEELEAEIWPLLEKGEIRPKIDRVFPLAAAAKAHSYMEARRHIGKIALKMD